MTTISRTDTSVLGRWWWTVDRWTLAAIAGIAFVGIIMILAASPAVAQRLHLDGFYFVRRQFALLVPALALMIGVSLLNPIQVRRLALLGLTVSIAFLVLTFFHGVEIKGARRWITLPLISLQPSEFLKPFFAVAAGWLIVVNPAPARPLPERLRACHPILIPNEHEAALLTGIDDPAQAALALTEQTHAAVIVSLGADGALVADDAGISVFSAVAVDVVDTTGAGDCLCGTFAARLAAGHDLSAALCDALEAATASTRLPGAR